MEWYLRVLLILGIVVGGITAIFLLYNLFLIICSLFVSNKKEYETDSQFYRSLLVSATWLFLKFVRVRVEVIGKEKLPEGRFLMVANHRSKFDPLITWVIFKEQHLAFISKEKNFKVFIFGRFIRKCAFMAIDRDDPRKAMKTIMKAADLMKRDVVSVAVYPEGTRNHNREMLPFRNGCFKSAKMANVPVCVLAMEGTHKIQQNFPKRGTNVRLTVCDVISAEEVKNLSTQEIGDRARESLKRVLDKEDY